MCSTFHEISFGKIEGIELPKKIHTELSGFFFQNDDRATVKSVGMWNLSRIFNKSFMWLHRGVGRYEIVVGYII